MIRLVFVCIVTVSLLGCGGSGNNDTQDPKNLFSLWVNTVTQAPLDLSSLSFSTASPIDFIFSGGEACQCAATVVGDDSRGAVTLNFCQYIQGTGSGIDPSCNAINGVSSYTINNSILTLCANGGDCSSFE